MTRISGRSSGARSSSNSRDSDLKCAGGADDPADFDVECTTSRSCNDIFTPCMDFSKLSPTHLLFLLIEKENSLIVFSSQILLKVY